MKQKTIKEPVEIKGTGLQTGQGVSLRLKGSPANSGINFIRTDLPNKPLLNIQSVDFDAAPLKERRTTLGLGPFEIQTTEHFLSALSGLSIDNIVAEISGSELPGLDGSAKGFVDALRKANIVEQGAPKRILKIEKPVWREEKAAFLGIFPSDDFKISYTLFYDSVIGTQFLSLIIDEGSFENEIAPARTFCLESEALDLLKRGFGKGADYENTLVIGKDGPVKNAYRFQDEPVRHKILDLMGDLYLLGASLKGHVVAVRSGHRLNLELVRELKKRI